MHTSIYSIIKTPRATQKWINNCITVDLINSIPSWFAGTSFESIDLNATSAVPWKMSTIGPEIKCNSAQY